MGIMRSLRLLSTEERFRLQTVKVKGECWNWIGAHDKDGYGWIRVDGVQTGAHRYSYGVHCGKIPKGMQVLHSCDNPRCVNPDHLFLGTQQDNVKDMVAKGRRANICGEESVNSKLTEKQVHEIRRRYIPRHPVNGCTAMAREFGMGRIEISRIVNRRRWKHI